MNNLIRTGLTVAIVFTAGTAGIAHNAVAHNSGSLSRISVLAAGPAQDVTDATVTDASDVTNDGFSWG